MTGLTLIDLPTRGHDKHGSGEYLASRGRRKHKGVDKACYPGTVIRSVTDGKVTKIGYPYSQGEPNVRSSPEFQQKFFLKKALRYVQVKDDKGRLFRYFYIKPGVRVGYKIKRGDMLGVTAELGRIYPEITEHCHFEVKLKGEYLNPNKVLEELS